MRENLECFYGGVELRMRAGPPDVTAAAVGGVLPRIVGLRFVMQIDAPVPLPDLHTTRCHPFQNMAGVRPPAVNELVPCGAPDRTTGQHLGEYSTLLPSVVVSSGVRHAQISCPDEVGFGSAGGVLFAAPYRAAEQSIETFAHHIGALKTDHVPRSAHWDQFGEGKSRGESL